MVREKCILQASPLKSKRETLQEFKKAKNIKVIRYKDNLYFKENITKLKRSDLKFNKDFTSRMTPDNQSPNVSRIEIKGDQIMNNASLNMTRSNLDIKIDDLQNGLTPSAREGFYKDNLKKSVKFSTVYTGSIDEDNIVYGTQNSANNNAQSKMRRSSGTKIIEILTDSKNGKTQHKKKFSVQKLDRKAKLKMGKRNQINAINMEGSSKNIENSIESEQELSKEMTNNEYYSSLQNDFQRVIDLCNAVSYKLNVCYEMVEKDPVAMQRIVDQLFRQMGVQKYYLEDYLQLSQNSNNPLGFKKLRIEKIKLGKYNKVKRTNAKTQNGDFENLNESKSNSSNIVISNANVKESIQGNKLSQFQFPAQRESRMKQSQRKKRIATSQSPLRKSIYQAQNVRKKELLSSKKKLLEQQQQREEILSMPHFFSIIYYQAKYHKCSFKKFLVLAQALTGYGKQTSAENVRSAFKNLGIKLIAKTIMLREIILFSSILTEFIMDIKKNYIGKSKYHIHNLIELIQKNDFRLSEHLSKQVIQSKARKKRLKVDRWNFNYLVDIVFEKDPKNIMDSLHKIEYDLRTKFKVSNDKKKLNINHRKLLESLKAQLREKKKQNDQTMVVWKKRKKNGFEYSYKFDK